MICPLETTGSAALPIAATSGNVLEGIIKIEKTNTMTKTWRNTKTKTDKDKNDGEERITVKFSN